MAIVEFKDVTRIYTSGDHELKALDGVNFTLDEGKFVVREAYRNWHNRLLSCCHHWCETLVP